MEEHITFRQKLKTLSMVHWSLVFMLIMMFVVFYFVLGDVEKDNNFDVLLYVPAPIFIVALLLSNILFQSALKGNLKPDKDLSHKIAAFQSAHLVRIAPFEAAGLFGLIVSMLTGNPYNYLVTAAAILMFLFFNPTADRISNELGLSQSERQQLLNE